MAVSIEMKHLDNKINNNVRAFDPEQMAYIISISDINRNIKKINSAVNPRSREAFNITINELLIENEKYILEQNISNRYIKKNKNSTINTYKI